MQHIKHSIIAAVALAFFPAVAHAENIDNLKELISYAINIMNSIIPLLFAIAVVGFIWGVTKYIYAAGPQKIGEARNYIIFSIIAIAVMLSVWGLAFMLKNSFFSSARDTYTPGQNTSGNVFNGNNSSSGSQNANDSILPDDCRTDDDCRYGFMCEKIGGRETGKCK